MSTQRNTTYRNESFVRLPRESGILPVNLLFSKSKLVRLDKLPNSLGICPVMLFPCNTLHEGKALKYSGITQEDDLKRLLFYNVHSYLECTFLPTKNLQVA